MKRIFIQSVFMTLALTVLLGLVYPLVITALVQVVFPEKANGQLFRVNGRLAGSRIIGQPFSSSGYFHSRPSAAGNGYDAANSGGSNLATTNKHLIQRVNDAVARENRGSDVPIDLVTASASGLDPDITPAAAYYQAERVARERHMTIEAVRELIDKRVVPRQFGVLGEPRVNVLELNLALDSEGARR